MKHSKVWVSLAAALVLSACQDAMSPTEGAAPATPPATNVQTLADEVLAAAWAQLPVDRAPGLTVGVLDEGLSPERATVVYITPDQRRTYAFTKTNESWSRRELLASEAIGAASTGLASIVFPNPIARVYKFNPVTGADVLYATVVTPDIVLSGTYSNEVWDATDKRISRAEFYTGQATVNNIEYYVDRLDKWEYWRGTSYNTCTWVTCYTLFSTLQSDRVKATYHVRVVRPVTVSFTSGVTAINWAHSYTWTASATGGDVEVPYTWRWEYSTDNVNWDTVGTSSSYTRVVSGVSHPSFYLKVTATSGRSATTTRYIPVRNPLYTQLSVDVTGPSYIRYENDSDWDYRTWSATVFGGVAPYTYQWQLGYEIFPGQFATVTGATGATMTHGVSPYDGNFYVRVIVTSSDGQQASYDHYVNVGSYENCGAQIFCD